MSNAQLKLYTSVCGAWRYERHRLCYTIHVNADLPNGLEERVLDMHSQVVVVVLNHGLQLTTGAAPKAHEHGHSRMGDEQDHITCNCYNLGIFYPQSR